MHIEANNAAVATILDRLEQLIYKSANAVDMEGKSISNISSDTYKMMFSELQRDCSGFATHLASALDSLFWFIRWDIGRKAEGGTIAFENIPFTIEFNMNMPINESEAIENAIKSQGLLSRQTSIGMHPRVKNVQDELSRLTEEENQADSYRGVFPNQKEVIPDEE